MTYFRSVTALTLAAIGLMVVTATTVQANNITVRYAEPDAAIQGLEALQTGNVEDAIRYLKRASRHDLECQMECHRAREPVRGSVR